jgi:acetyl-CoA carboxylase carboxyl transferase subunit beta
MAWWKRDDRGLAANADRKSVPKGVWTKCAGCAEILVESELTTNLGVCPRCDYHHPVSARQRLELILDPGSFEELGQGIEPLDPLGFKDSKKYRDRTKAARKKTGISEAAIVGLGRLEGMRLGIGALAFEYLGGSMGSVVGERITRMLEAATEQRCPAVISSASGGARMQEGILSLMQMAKTTAALRLLKEAGLPYISVLHHPTTGGVAASFAMLGDVIIAEPKALVGFAGPRVIEQTIRQKLPEGFQRSEFLLEHGMVDVIVPRKELRQRLGFLLRTLSPHRG